MRILCMLTYYWPHRTGLTRYAQTLAEELSHRGHHVTILTSRYLDSLPRDQMLNGVRVVRLRSIARISRGQVVPGFPLAAYRLIQEHDVVLIHAPMLETPVAVLLAKHLGRGVVITHHGDLVLPSGALNRVIEAVMIRLFHAAAGTAHGLVALSDDYAEHSSWIRPHIDRTTVLYPPVQLPPPSPDGRARIRARLGVGARPLIGYSGRFVEEKRPDLLLRALPHLDGILPGAHVAFAGQYIMPYEKFYQRHVRLVERFRDRAHFLGLIEDDHELADFYSACDVLALPSDTDNFPLVQVEAMLSGTPVVVTDIPGAREAVRVSGMGEVVRPRDTLALARTLARVIQRRDEYVKPRERIMEIFNVQRTIDGYEALLRDAAEHADAC
ncbi:MAG TPA: glycosyltransferase family 4 protein [Dehalococcoidia bacterium]